MMTELFNETPVVPVVVIDEVTKAIRIADTLLSAGIETIEVTLRTDVALMAIEELASAKPEICVGAGSIRQVGQISEAISAGARFFVSPGFNAGIIAEAKRRQAVFIPGAATATEVMQLAEHGYDFVKFFPAELSGGVTMLKALSAPLPEVRFFPTGGITADLALSYLELPCVKCIGGSWFVPAEKIREGDFDWIYQETLRVTELLNG